MSMPFYISPEQLVKDRADFARKGIARGRSVIVGSCLDGVVFVADNPSRSLHKVSEIYDRIAFAAVGKYNEFENLRVAGVRYADMRGYSYARSDVTARALANAYSQSLGAMFTQGPKPFEVELAVAEVGAAPEQDELYRLTFDGSIADESGFIAMGGQSEALDSRLAEEWQPGLALADAVRLAARLLFKDASESTSDSRADSLEVALLDRARPRRTFRRVTGAAVSALLATPGEVGAP